MCRNKYCIYLIVSWFSFFYCITWQWMCWETHWPGGASKALESTTPRVNLNNFVALYIKLRVNSYVLKMSAVSMLKGSWLICKNLFFFFDSHHSPKLLMFLLLFRKNISYLTYPTPHHSITEARSSLCNTADVSFCLFKYSSTEIDFICKQKFPMGITFILKKQCFCFLFQCHRSRFLL